MVCLSLNFFKRVSGILLNYILIFFVHVHPPAFPIVKNAHQDGKIRKSENYLYYFTISLVWYRIEDRVRTARRGGVNS